MDEDSANGTCVLLCICVIAHATVCGVVCVCMCDLSAHVRGWELFLCLFSLIGIPNGFILHLNLSPPLH